MADAGAGFIIIARWGDWRFADCSGDIADLIAAIYRGLRSAPTARLPGRRSAGPALADTKIFRRGLWLSLRLAL